MFLVIAITMGFPNTRSPATQAHPKVTLPDSVNGVFRGPGGSGPLRKRAPRVSPSRYSSTRYSAPHACRCRTEHRYTDGRAGKWRGPRARSVPAVQGLRKDGRLTHAPCAGGGNNLVGPRPQSWSTQSWSKRHENDPIATKIIPCTRNLRHQWYSSANWRDSSCFN